MDHSPVRFAQPTNVTWRPGILKSTTWREFGYLCAFFALSIPAFTFAVLVPSLAAGLAVTVVGLLPVGWLLLGARWWGALYRRLAARLLHQHIAEPPRFVAPVGFWRRLGAMFTDGTSLRAWLFTLLTLPLGTIAFCVSVTVLATGLGLVAYPIYWGFLGPNIGWRGEVGYGFSLGPLGFADSPASITLTVLVGVALLLVWPPLNHAFAQCFRALGCAFLAETPGAIRVAQLRAQRAAAVTSADERLRAIERDLHDGTQARLVAVAMQLGEAREELAAGGDPSVATDLVTTAHLSTQEALAELRDIARGIHPPALDNGLGVALQTLAARAALPVSVYVAPELVGRDRTSPAISSILYYAAAELIANATKHASASVVQLRVERTGGGGIRLTVADDGCGGAHVVPDAERVDGARGTGLSGIAARIALVDGALAITSPPGGGTTAVVTVP